MANPSTTGPSGIGSEVLRRVWKKGNNDHQNVITVGTDMIVTLLSLVIVNNTVNDNQNMNFYILPDGGTAQYLYIGDGNFMSYQTFVFSDKVVMTETDVLKVHSSATTFDVWCSYIEQEFA